MRCQLRQLTAVVTRWPLQSGGRGGRGRQRSAVRPLWGRRLCAQRQRLRQQRHSLALLLRLRLPLLPLLLLHLLELTVSLLWCSI